MTRAELKAAGITDAGIRVLVRRGDLTSVDRGVYARADPAARLRGRGERGERLLRLAAAIALVGPDVVAGHQDAAIVHGLPLLDHPTSPVLSVSRPRGVTGRRASRPGLSVSATTLPRDQVTVREGVPVTTVARTVIDLARNGPFAAGVVVADAALHGKRTTEAELRAVIEACARWPGVGRARQVVDFADGRSESPFESISRVAFRDGGLPPPELQAWVGDEDAAIGRVDFLWREHGTIAEADGAMKYADPDRARLQLWRDARLREAGFEVVHFSWRQLTAAPDQVLRSVRLAFRRSRALRTGGSADSAGPASA